MCIDDGRVVSNFVAQVCLKMLHFFDKKRLIIYPSLDRVLSVHNNYNVIIFTGLKEGAIDCLRRWGTN